MSRPGYGKGPYVKKGQMLATLALNRISVSEREQAEVPLMEWIPRVSPGYISPYHLKPLIDRLETFRTKPLRLVLHAPPRHVKTETLLHFFAKSLKKEPKLIHGYITYEATLAKRKSAIARAISRRAGVPMDERQQALSGWRTAYGGGLQARGIGGPFTGEGVSGLMVIDDPVKNRLEAESAVIRERQWDWFNDVARTRLERGASMIICMTRWHEDDLAGRAIKEGYEFLRLPALNDGVDPNRGIDEPLCPELFNKEYLLDLKVRNEYSFASIYQGLPRPRGERIFNDIRTFRELPNSGNRWGGGLDLAYTKKTASDWSVLVRGVWGGVGEGALYIYDCIRVQVQAPKFKQILARANEEMPNGHAGFLWYTGGGPEEGISDFIGDDLGMEGHIPLESKPATTDKRVRSTPYAASWNAGKVFLPEKGSQWYGQWVREFVDEHLDFTGTGADTHDDQVDAGAALHDLLCPGSDMARWEALAKG